jgi:hypothetical protein
MILPSVVDPDSLNLVPDTNPDPALQVNPDPDKNRIQGFDDQKLQKFFFFFFFRSEIAICLSLGLHKGRPNYRRSLQPSKEITSIQKIKFVNCFLFSGSFLPSWIRIRNTDFT